MSGVLPTIQNTQLILQDKETIINSIEFKQGKTIQIFGQDIDINTLTVICIGIILSILLWWYTGLLKMIYKDKVMFFLFLGMIGFFIGQIFLSSSLSGNITLETSKLVSINQIISTFLGSLVIFMYVLNKLTDKKLIKNTNFLLFIVIAVLIIGHARVNVKTDGSQIRILRQIKETLFNVTIFTTLAVIYLAGEK
jgi:hypothetical protein